MERDFDRGVPPGHKSNLFSFPASSDVLCKPQLPDRLRAWELVEVFAEGGESEGGGSTPSSPARPFRVGLDDPEDGGATDGATNEANLIPQRSAADDR